MSKFSLIEESRDISDDLLLKDNSEGVKLNSRKIQSSKIHKVAVRISKSTVVLRQKITKSQKNNSSDNTNSISNKIIRNRIESIKNIKNSRSISEKLGERASKTVNRFHQPSFSELFPDINETHILDESISETTNWLNGVKEDIITERNSALVVANQHNETFMQLFKYTTNPRTVG